MQAMVLALAGLMIFDGLFGPQLAPKNLATVGAWVHYRGLAVLALLLAGNLFCMACPFMLPRQAAARLRERFLRGGLKLPLLMRSKWPAVTLVVLFFFAYELFDLWATPWWTAWVVVGYFVIAFAVDMVFRGASFCKHICPLGQFNFFGSLISPLEIKVREAGVCAGCETKDCIRALTPRPPLPPSGWERGSSVGANALPLPRPKVGGGGRGVRAVRGCELALFQPRKVGNMDCTFCLDCIHACPYDNIGFSSRTPTRELWSDPFRSGIGRFGARRDLMALMIVFIFGAFLNAFAMIRPVYALQAGLASAFRTTSEVPGLLLIFALGLVILPAALLAIAGALSHAAGRDLDLAFGYTVRRFVYALVPMGFAMWLAHYAFHFLTGALTIVPVSQSFLADIGLYAGPVQWEMGPLAPMSWLFPIEALLLYLGAFGSIIAAVQIGADIASTAARSPQRRLGQSGRGHGLWIALPWIVLTLVMLGFGIWILLQPMEMRGTMSMVAGVTQ
jgi:ferredoxin